MTSIEDAPSERTFECGPCKLQFSSEEEFQEHDSTHMVSSSSGEPGTKVGGHQSSTSPAESRDVDSTSSRPGRSASRKALFQPTKERPYMCKTCGATFVRSDHLNRHRKIIHEGIVTPQQPYKTIKLESGDAALCCPDCAFTCQARAEMFDHSRTHDGKPRPYRCDECDVTFTRKDHLNRHNKRRHGINRFPREVVTDCDVCDASFNTVGALREHKKEAHESWKRHHKCEECGCGFLTKSHLDRHVQTVHKKSPKKTSFPNHGEEIERGNDIDLSSVVLEELTPEESANDIIKPGTKKCPLGYPCDACELAGDDRYDYNLYQCQSLIHSTKSHSCALCEFTCNDALELAKHRCRSQTFHSCELCEFTCNDALDLEKHVKTHSETSRPYRCDSCGASFSCQRHLHNHDKIHQRDSDFLCSARGSKVIHIVPKSYSCVECDFTCDGKPEYSAHKKSHESSLQCPVCRLKFKTKHALAKHESSHKTRHRNASSFSDFKYACELCDFTTDEQIKFVRHSQTHPALLPFQCDSCDFASAEKALLRAHAASHANNRPWGCTVCGASFSRHNQLVRHMKTHKRDREFVGAKRISGSLPKTAPLDMDISAEIEPGKKSPKVSLSRLRKCDQCDYFCVEFRTLKNHMKSHEGSQNALSSNLTLETSTTKGGDNAATTKGGDNAATTKGGDNAVTTKGGDNVTTTKGCDNAATTKGHDNVTTTKGGDNAVTTKGDDNVTTTKGDDNAATIKGDDNAATTTGAVTTNSDDHAAVTASIPPERINDHASETLETNTRVPTTEASAAEVAGPGVDKSPTPSILAVQGVRSSSLSQHAPYVLERARTERTSLERTSMEGTSLERTSPVADTTNCSSSLLQGSSETGIHCNEQRISEQIIDLNDVGITLDEEDSDDNSVIIVLQTPATRTAAQDTTKITSAAKRRRVNSNPRSKLLKQYKCATCGQGYMYTGGFFNHLRATNHKPAQDVFSCEVCDFMTLSKESLAYHCKVHANGTFTCHMCQKVLVTAEALAEHVEELHCEAENGGADISANGIGEESVVGMSKFKCRVCDVRFTQKSQLTMHEKVHAEETGERFPCSKCTHVAGSQGDLIWHEGTHGEVMRCSRCSYECKSAFLFDLHRKLHLLKCLPCNVAYDDELDLTEHLNTHTYQCSICAYHATSQEALDSHEHLAMCRCPVCREVVLDHPALDKHMAIHAKLKLLDRHGEPAAGKKKLVKTEFRCELCNRNFYKRSLYEAHMRIHSQERCFQCQYCSRRFNHASNLKSHEKRIHESKREDWPFLCATCGKRFLLAWDLKKHAVKHMDKVTYRCPECDFTSYRRNTFNRHLGSHDQSRKHRCRHEGCTKAYLSEPELISHIKKAHEKPPFQCTQCAEEFTFKRHYVRHVKAHCRKPCPRCSFIGNSQEELESHAKIHDNKCSICDMQFQDSASLKAHMPQHPKEKNYACKVCGILFSFRYNLVTHMKKHMGTINKKHSCPFCDYRAARRVDVLKHIRKHTGEKPHKCPICPKKYSQKSHMLVHLRIHSDRQPYKCLQCPMAYSKISVLHKHTRTAHLGLKPYQCRLCPNRSYFTSHGLKQHYRIHVGARPYSCAVCSKTFARKSALVKHQIRESGAKAYACNVCIYQSNEPREILKHQSGHRQQRKYACTQCRNIFATKSLLTRHSLIHKSGKPFMCRSCDFLCENWADLIRHVKGHATSNFKCMFCSRTYKRKFNLVNHVKRHFKMRRFKPLVESDSLVEYVIQETTITDGEQILESSGVFLHDGTQVVLQNAEEISEHEYVMIVNSEDSNIAPDDLYNLIETGDGEYSVVVSNSETQDATDIIQGIINEEPVVLSEESMVVAQEPSHGDATQEIVVTIEEAQEEMAPCKQEEELDDMMIPLPVDHQEIPEVVIPDESTSQNITVQEVHSDDIVIQEGTGEVVLTDENGDYVVLVDEDQKENDESENKEMQFHVTSGDGKDYFFLVKDKSDKTSVEVKELVATETDSEMFYQAEEGVFYVMGDETVVPAE